MNTKQMGEMWTQMGSLIASLMFAYAMFQQFVPYSLRAYFEQRTHKLVAYVNPYIQITFHEYTGERIKRSDLYSAIENYLSVNSSGRAKRLKAETTKDSKSVVLSMDDYEEVTDDFRGAKLWWAASKKLSKPQSFPWYPAPAADDKGFYTLTFHRRHRDLITSAYLTHVVSEGNAIFLKNRQRKLYTNSSGYDHGWKKTLWSHVAFEHPASFDTLAMEAKKKQDIINDLITFSKSKQYYSKIGKAWKRGYLLYGPPGTGKSTMIAAMANLLGYDVYDLELTAVWDNSQLRNLLIGVSPKSIIVIEDIDCSLELTGQRKKKKEDEKCYADKLAKDPNAMIKEAQKIKSSKVTLSGLLNFIDGLWSACGGERIIVFTTNYLEKLDPALIRRGRMDMHIELSYCCFDAFKVLAKNYWDIDEHELFGAVRRLLKEVEMTPADVAENLMPRYGEDVGSSLNNLIEALKKAKEDARIKVEEEAKQNAEMEEEEEEVDEENAKEKGAQENGNEIDG